MFENLKLFRNWYRLAKPNKSIWFISSFAVVLAYTCLLIAPLFSAKAVVCITSGNYWGASLHLFIVFCLLALRNVFWVINYRVYNKLIGSIYGRLNNLFVEKMLCAKSSNFKKTPKEKIMNIVHSDVYSLAEVADKSAICAGRIFMLVVTIIILLFINIWVGFAVIIANILNFILLNYLETRRAKCVKKLREDNDIQYQKFCEIVDSRQTINDLALNQTLKKRYNNHIKTYIDDLGKKTNADSSVAQGFFVFYNFMIFVLTLAMVLLVSKGQLSVEMYFIIVPYITNGIETTSLVFEFMPYLKNSGIYASRIKTVLEFTEKEEIPVGDIENNNLIGYMEFSDVSYKGDKEGNPSLKNINLRINALQTTLIIGAKSSGKRTLFHLMHRNILPKSGEISLDGLNILEYSNKVFSQNFNYLTTRPNFFNGSIIQNLKLVNKNRNKILAVLSELNLIDYINGLPQKIYTNILTLPFDKQYLLGLARVLLTGAEVIALYEFPSGLSADEKQNIKNLLYSLMGKRTIVLFSSNESLADISDKVVYIERGQIKQIQYTNNRHFFGWERDVING